MIAASRLKGSSGFVAVFRPSQMNRVTKTDAQTRTRPVVTLCEPWRRPIVPVCIKREIPIQLPPKLDVIRRVGGELKSSRIRKRRQQIGGEVESCSIETKQLEPVPSNANDTRCVWAGTTIC